MNERERCNLICDCLRVSAQVTWYLAFQDRYTGFGLDLEATLVEQTGIRTWQRGGQREGVRIPTYALSIHSISD